MQGRADFLWSGEAEMTDLVQGLDLGVRGEAFGHHQCPDGSHVAVFGLGRPQLALALGRRGASMASTVSFLPLRRRSWRLGRSTSTTSTPRRRCRARLAPYELVPSTRPGPPSRTRPSNRPRRRVTASCWDGWPGSARWCGSGWRAPAATGPAWPVTCAGRGWRWSRWTAPTAKSVAAKARPTPWTPSRPPMPPRGTASWGKPSTATATWKRSGR